MHASLAAFAGRVEEARRSASEALEAADRCRSHNMRQWPILTLAFIEVSLGNHQAAIAIMEPLIAYLDAAPDAAEFIPAVFVPDAVEALISLGRLTEAEPLIDRLLRNGRKTNRPWMLAIGGRCQAMLLAARGESAKACDVACEAIVYHEQLPMPFERARTQLLVGQLQRRLRQTAAAAASFQEALATFEDLNIPLWANRARTELDRTNIGSRPSAALTPSEQRVAEMVASGMTIRDVASTLLVSPKTVETNLARVYRKLGIHSRAELGRLMGSGVE
jgi:DNA-binding CsgD family transcriptional regulator